MLAPQVELVKREHYQPPVIGLQTNQLGNIVPVAGEPVKLSWDSLLVAWAGQTQMGALPRAAGEIVHIWLRLLAVNSQMFEDANMQAHQCFSKYCESCGQQYYLLAVMITFRMIILVECPCMYAC